MSNELKKLNNKKPLFFSTLKMTYTNTTNIFNYIPNDVLQHVLNPFLEGNDRANFNTILEPTERLSKKFPSDFAIHHSIITFMPSQRRHALEVRKSIDTLEHLLLYDFYNPTFYYTKKKALKALRQYVIFLYSVQGTIIIQYRQEAKERALNDLNYFIGDECPLEPYIKPKLREAIQDVIESIEDTPFLRNVDVPEGFRENNSIYPPKN
jgi:hypothetical protein